MLRTIQDRYQLEEKIGVGALAEVYRARGTADGQLYAVKMMRERWADEESYRSRFQREIEIGKRVAASAARDWTLPIVDEGVEESVPYFVTPYMPYNLRELLQGSTLLKTKSSDSEQLMEDLWLPFLNQLASAVDALHEAGYVHGDLKPSNILADEKVRPKIIDFGTAQLPQIDYRSFYSTVTRDLQEPAIAGTLAYMAPEQFEGASPTKATDLYALGTLTWEIMYGQLPYPLYPRDTQFTYGQRKGTQLPRAPSGPQVPDSVRQVLLRSLRRDPRLRFPSARAFVQELEAAWKNPNTYQLHDPPPVLPYLVVGYTCLTLVLYLVVQRLWLWLGR